MSAVEWKPFCDNASCPCMEPNIAGPCGEYKQTERTNERCGECGWPPDRHAAKPTMVRPWWRGLTADHIYERCPGLQRSMLALRKAGWDERVDTNSLDPEGGDVCGWCLRVWRARRVA